MSKKYLLNFLFIFSILSDYLFTQTSSFQSSIGYVYPAGGQKGTTFEIIIGGQFLRNVKDIYFSTDGIKAEEVIYIPNLSPQQKQLLTKKIREIVTSRIRGKPLKTDTSQDQKIKLPDHPFLQDLENKTNEELKKIFELFIFPLRREQIKRSIQEKILAKITISDDLKPGVYELRAFTQFGLSNPLYFYVGEFPEVREKEQITPFENIPKEVFELPVVINGQIMPGDTDRFYFNAKKGQNLVIELKGRDIIPYMADAVPGWFQGVLTLYDSKGREIAYADDYRFNPDPVIFYKVPEDGEYMIEVRDALYRGREDFVYRLFIGEKPFISYIFPPGGRKGTKTNVSLSGFNLPEKNLELDTEKEVGIYKTSFFFNGISSNPVFYAVDELPEIIEKEPNDSIKNSYEVSIPCIINGVISKPGDIDIFKFKCPAGFKLVAEVYSRRLGYPMDSFISLMDSSGKTLISNDDYVDKNFDLLTHHSDSYIYFEIPESGTYYLKISDIQNHGGEEYIYRLKISPANPDFSLFVFHSSLNIIQGNTVPFYVYAVRKDGFNGEIKLKLKNPSSGFVLNGGIIPSDKNKMPITLTLNSSFIPSNKPISVEIEGIAIIDRKEIKKVARPAEEMMQAFAYFHLVPSSELLIFSRRRFLPPLLTLLDEKEVIEIPQGGTAKIECKISQFFKNERIILELKNPSEGISIDDINIENDLLSFIIKVDKKIKSGFSDNLIMEIFSEPLTDSGQTKRQKIPRGFLPAIPIKII